MKLPERYPFTIEMINPASDDTDDQYEELKKQNDVYYEQRFTLKKLMLNEIMLPFGLFRIKYNTLTKLTAPQDSVKDILLLNLLQDSLRQNVSDLSELTKSTLFFLSKCNGIHSHLFRRNAQEKFFNAVILTSPIDSKQNILQFSDEINEKRQNLFVTFGDQGNIQDISWYWLKKKIEILSEEIKDYRNTIGSHNSSADVTLTITVLNKLVEEFEKIINNLYLVLCFERKGDYTGPGIAPENTINFLTGQIW